ncbi:MAG: hypothetical protein MJ252_09920, partial [archaeon]|nr:hypothetical protein [archaeon]
MSNKSSEEFFSTYNLLLESFDDYFNQDDFQSIETELIKWENLMSNPIHAKTFLLFSPLEQLFNLINTMPSLSDILSSELRNKIEEHILGIFTKLIEYFNKKNLILFILRCFSYFKESKNISYFNRLSNLIEVAMKNQREKHNSTSIYLSSVSIPNPNVYNFIYIPSLDSSIEKSQFLFFGIWIKFTRIECLHNF